VELDGFVVCNVKRRSIFTLHISPGPMQKSSSIPLPATMIFEDENKQGQRLLTMMMTTLFLTTMTCISCRPRTVLYLTCRHSLGGRVRHCWFFRAHCIFWKRTSPDPPTFISPVLWTALTSTTVTLHLPPNPYSAVIPLPPIIRETAAVPKGGSLGHQPILILNDYWLPRVMVHLVSWNLIDH